MDANQNTGPANESDHANQQVRNYHINLMAQQVGEIAPMISTHLGRDPFSIVPLREVQAKEIIPFLDQNGGQVVPISATNMAKVIPGYREPDPELVENYTTYAQANYGTAPGPGLAVIASIARALKPDTVFVFGTGRGRIESEVARIAENAIVTTLDLPQELIGVASGTPDKNNTRYRNGLGITGNGDIGSEFSRDPQISNRVKQLLGDSFEFEPGPLADTQRMIIVDGNHSYDNVLKDGLNAISLAHSQGAVLVFDDYAKDPDFNRGVEAAVGLLSRVTGLPVLRPRPGPNEEGVTADLGVIIIPEGFDKEPATRKLRAILELISEGHP